MKPQHEYLAVLEPGTRNWSAYSPDVLGCIATGPTREETRRNFAGALKSHLNWMRDDGDSLPPPLSETDFVTIALPGHAPRRYLVILTPTTPGSWSVTPADVPDLVLEFSDCAGALRLLRGALQDYLEEQIAEGQSVPEPSSEAVTISVEAEALSVAA